MGQTAYKQLWRIVDGAVTDAFNRHPDYLTKSGRKYATASIVKRVTGTVLSFAEQSARAASAAATASGDPFQSAPSGEAANLTRLHSPAHVSELCYQAVRRALFPVGRRAVRRDAKRYMRAFLDTTEKLRKELRRPLVGEAAFQRAVSLGGWDGMKLGKGSA